MVRRLVARTLVPPLRFPEMARDSVMTELRMAMLLVLLVAAPPGMLAQPLLALPLLALPPSPAGHIDHSGRTQKGRAEAAWTTCTDR